MTPERAKELLPIIQAFADGKTVQMQDGYNGWLDLPSPTFQSNTTYRIKPDPIKYRLALFKYNGRTWVTVLNADESTSIEDYPQFNRWITDWIEVEV